MRVLLPWSGKRRASNNNSQAEPGLEEPYILYDNHEESVEVGSCHNDTQSPNCNSSATSEEEGDSLSEATFVAAASNPAELSSDHEETSTRNCKRRASGEPEATSASQQQQKQLTAAGSCTFTCASTKRHRAAEAKLPPTDMAVGGRRKNEDDGSVEVDDDPVYSSSNSGSNANPYWPPPSENEPPPALPNDPWRGVVAAESASAVAVSTAQQQEPSLQRFRDSLKERGLEMVEQEGDGNCLFRAVSLQVYGQADNHGQVREQCMDFMARNAEHYANFVASENLTFPDYVLLKRRDGVHGNHAEIQAISELFNRPIEVYQPQQQLDAPFQPMNIFHAEYKTSDPPIRLSYHNNNHYNAVVDPLVPTAGLGLGLPGLKPGLADKMQVTQAKAESDRLADDMELQRILRESKDEHKAQEEDQLQRILKASSVDFVSFCVNGFVVWMKSALPC